MKRKLLALFTAALLATGVTAEKASAGDADVFGAVLGAATGGFIGSNIGSGDGRLAATAAGTLLGAIIGHEMGTTVDARDRYETMRGTVYRRPVYNRTVYQPVRVAPRPAAKRKVVVHKHKVVVKHVYADRRDDRHGYRTTDRWNKKQWKKRQARKRQFEKRRRQLARACYDHPRRCAQAF